MKMTFHEYYGQLPVKTLRLIKRFNVSPADFDMIIDSLGVPTWDEVNGHITINSQTGIYRPDFF